MRCGWPKGKDWEPAKIWEPTSAVGTEDKSVALPGREAQTGLTKTIIDKKRSVAQVKWLGIMEI